MSGEVKNCSLCGNLYVDTGGGACSGCLAELEEMKARLESFIADHPNAKLTEVVARTGLSDKIITRYFTMGELTDACPRCGAPMLEGKYCKACLTILHTELAAGRRRGMQAKAREMASEVKKARRMNFGH